MNATADRDMNAYWDRAGRVWVEQIGRAHV